jgi:hypothetical protein
MSFEVLAIILAAMEACFIGYEILEFVKMSKSELDAVTKPKFWKTKQGILGALFNWFIGIINLLKLATYVIYCTVALGKSIHKSPGFAFDIGVTMGFAFLFGSAMSALTMTMSLAASNIFSIMILFWGHGRRKEVAVAA